MDRAAHIHPLNSLNIALYRGTRNDSITWLLRTKLLCRLTQDIHIQTRINLFWSLLAGAVRGMRTSLRKPSPAGSDGPRPRSPTCTPRHRTSYCDCPRAKQWRRKRDSNPRNACTLNGFQDRRIQPLCHSSGTCTCRPACTKMQVPT